MPPKPRPFSVCVVELSAVMLDVRCKLAVIGRGQEPMITNRPDNVMIAHSLQRERNL